MTRFFNYGQHFEQRADLDGTGAAEVGTALGENIFAKYGREPGAASALSRPSGDGEAAAGGLGASAIRVTATEPVWDTAPGDGPARAAREPAPRPPPSAQVATKGLDLLSSLIGGGGGKGGGSNGRCTPGLFLVGEMPGAGAAAPAPALPPPEAVQAPMADAARDTAEIAKIQAEFGGLDESFEGFGGEELLSLMDTVGF